jgi:nitroreductase
VTITLDRALAERRSLRALNPRPIEPAALRHLFEAARAASSAFNEQPWHYVVLDDATPEETRRVLDCMAPHNRAWAEKAPVVIASIAQLGFRARDGINRHSFHDVGQANAHLALKAAELGMTVHLVGGFDPAAAGAVLALPEGFDVVALITLAYPGSPDDLPEDLRRRELAPRSRRPLEAFTFHGRWLRAFEYEDAPAC